MSQVQLINKTLKQLLKREGLTYKALANKLDMSEANVKRIFAKGSFTLERLEQICEQLPISLMDFMGLVAQQHELPDTLTVEQEQSLVSDHKLLLVALCLRDGWQANELLSYYQLNPLELTQLLAKLDRLKIISLLPDNKYRFLIKQNFQWQADGPIAKFIHGTVIKEFLAHSFSHSQQIKSYIPGTYSSASLAKLIKAINDLKQLAANLNQQDANLPTEQRQHAGLLLAFREWELSVFTDFKRK